MAASSRGLVAEVEIHDNQIPQYRLMRDRKRVSDLKVLAGAGLEKTLILRLEAEGMCICLIVAFG
jgi:hypothetical protein